MKTLVNKNNPKIRITAPEIEVQEESEMYLIPVSDYCIPMCIDDWTLVDEESKHTEVWVEGRTIFEQDAKKPEMDLEKAADISANEVYPPMIEVYPRIPNSTCVEFKQKVIDHNAHNRVLHIEGFKAGAEWQKKQPITFNCIGKQVTMTIQELIDYYIDSECADVADECGF